MINIENTYRAVISDQLNDIFDAEAIHETVCTFHNNELFDEVPHDPAWDAIGEAICKQVDADVMQYILSGLYEEEMNTLNAHTNYDRAMGVIKG